jgi:aspartate/methionine/tyrosine aminotransferase
MGEKKMITGTMGIVRESEGRNSSPTCRKGTSCAFKLNPDDEYVTECPLYQQSVGLAESLGCKVKQFPLDENNEWKPDLEQLQTIVTNKTKIISFNNPNNPTGALLTDQEMRVICEIAEDVNAYVICDNALRGSELDGNPAITPFEYYDKGIITGSISKLGMTGPRIGWIIGRKDLVDACWVVKDYTTLSHSGIGEYLSLIALQRENRLKYIRRNLEFSKANLSILSKWMDKHQDMLSWVAPKAGYTAFPAYNLPLSSEEFCQKFLEEEHVLISPGEYFGVEKHFRINIGCEERTFIEALTRLETFMNRQRR